MSERILAPLNQLSETKQVYKSNSLNGNILLSNKDSNNMHYFAYGSNMLKNLT